MCEQIVFCSFAGCVYTSVGVVYIFVWCPLPVRFGHRIPGVNRDLRPLAGTKFWTSQLHTLEGHISHYHRCAGTGAGHIHQLE